MPGRLEPLQETRGRDGADPPGARAPHRSAPAARVGHGEPGTMASIGTDAREAGAPEPRAGLSLHEEALADLRKSGLSDITIAAAGLYTPPPGDLLRLLSPRLVDKVRHVLVFPYDGVTSGVPMHRPEEFVRCKLFPPVSDGHGHTMRYYQRSGPPPRLYIPPPARAVLADPTVPLFITEGEKKALRANQERLACLAVGGLWNWQTDKRAIADLDRVDWVDRETVIVPD